MPAQARIWAVLGLNDAQFNRGIRRTERRLKNLASSTRTIGNDLTRYVSLPLALGGAASIKFATDFEASMMKIRTLVGIPKKFTDAWGEVIKTMSGDVGRGPNELAEALFFVTSAGIRSAKALDVVRMSAQASVIGLGETKSVARTVVAAMQAWSKANLTAKESVDTLVATVRYGNVESEELAGSMGRVMGIAAEMGVSFAEVGAFIATYTRVGVDANIATTALRATLSTLLRPGEQAAAVLSTLGTNTEELHDSIRKRGLAQTLIDMTGALSGNIVALGQLNPNVRALSGVLAVASSQAKAYLQITKDMTEGTVDSAREFAIASGTMRFQFDKLKAALESLAITVGEHLMPAVRKFTAWATVAVGELNDLDEATAKSVGGWLLFAAAIGPVLIGFSLLLKILSPLGVGIVTLSRAVLHLTQSFIALRAAVGLSGALSAWGLIAAGVAIVALKVVAAVLLLGFTLAAAFVDSEAIRPWLVKLGTLGKWIDRTIVAFKLAGDAALLFLLAVEIAVQGVIDQTVGNLLRVLALLPGALGTAAQMVADNVRASLYRNADLFKKMLGEMDDALEEHFAAWANVEEVPFMLARPDSLEQMRIDAEHLADEIAAAAPEVAKMQNIFGEGGLFAEAGKGAAKLTAFFAKARTAAEDAADTTELDKYNRKVQRGAEELKILIDAIIMSGKEGRAALDAAALQAGINFDAYSIFTGGPTAGMALMDEFLKSLEKGRKAAEAFRQETEAASSKGQFTTLLSGMEASLHDALDSTPAEMLNREIERNTASITEFHNKLTALGGPGAQVLSELNELFGIGGSSLKDYARWVAKTIRDTKELIKSTEAMKSLKGFFKDLSEGLEDALAITDSEKFELKLARGRMKVTELWAALNAEDRSDLARALDLTTVSLEGFLAKYEDGEERIREASEKIRFNLGEMLAGSISEVFTGILRGTRDLSDLVNSYKDIVVSIFGKMIEETIKKKLKLDKVFEKNFLEYLPDMVQRGVTKMGNVLGRFFEWAMQLIIAIGQSLGIGTPGTPGPTGKLPEQRELATGGITTGPTLAMIGDNPSGKEAIIPLERWDEVMGRVGGGGGGISVEIHAPTALESQSSSKDSSGGELIQFIFEGAKRAVAGDIMEGGVVGRSIEAAFSSRRTGGR